MSRRRANRRYSRSPSIRRPTGPQGPGRIGLALLVGAVALASCDDPTPLPTAPEDDVQVEGTPPSQQGPRSGESIFSDRAHALPGGDYEVLSTPEEMAVGQYRIRSLTGEVETVPRDDFVIMETPDGEVRIRRVLSSSVSGDELILDTGPGYWHDVVQGGVYAISVPFDGNESSISVPLPADAPAGVSGTLTSEGLPPFEVEFANEDLCVWVQDFLDSLPGEKERFGCGEEHEIDLDYVKVAGTLDTLMIRSGHLRATGEFNLFMNIDEGGIEGGRRPTFAPCNRGAYLGCLTTPTGAALVEFLRRYAPAIPEASIPPNRVCVPGTPVRIRRGHWSGFTWVPPLWEVCRITDFGELPTITLPSVQEVTSTVIPTVSGEMIVRVQGDVGLTLDIPVPYLGAGKKINFSEYFQIELKAGVFFLLKTELRNGGGTARFTLDATSIANQHWTSSAGWSSGFQLTSGSFTHELLYLDNPDTVLVRVAFPVKVSANVCLGLTACASSDSTATPDSVPAADSKFGGADGGPLFRNGELSLAGEGPGTPVWTNAGAWDGAGTWDEPSPSLEGPNPDIKDWILKKVKVGAGVGAAVSMFYDLIWSREELNADPYVDNWHISMEQAYDLTLSGKVQIPLTGWILPNVPRSFDKRWECCRIPISDYWGQGRLLVTTETTGNAPDPDGYAVVVQRADTFPAILDPGTTRLGTWAQRVHELGIEPTGSAVFGVDNLRPCIGVYSDAFLTGNPVWGLSVAGARAAGLNIPSYGVTSPCPWLIARYQVTLGGVSDHCTVSADGPMGVRAGAQQDSVWLLQKNRSLERGDTTYLHFTVDCNDPGPLGDLRVVLPSALADADPPPTVLLDGVPEGGFAESDTLVITDLSPGTREVSLAGLPSNCVSSAASVEVVADAVVTVEPTAACAIPDLVPGSVQFLSLTTGGGDDGNGFTILLDGVAAASLYPGGQAVVEGLAPETPAVLNVWDIAGNCQPQAPNPRVVTLDATATPVTVEFPVRCTDTVADTLMGTVDAQTWPILSVTFRGTDGRTLAVKGPKAAELAALTGTSARIWGTASATDIDVHGYDLRSKLGDDRWMGIVIHRPGDGTWLFGDEAIRLVDPPPALIQASESLIWVMGVETSEGIQPTLFGIIREAGS